MVAKEGYPIETHVVITEDCYILEMHRIPYGKKSPHVKGESPRPAVYLQHGLLSSSTDWVMGTPEKYLGEIYIFENILERDGRKRPRGPRTIAGCCL